MRKIIILIVFGLVFVFAGLSSVFSYFAHQSLVINNTGYTLVVSPGSNINQISNNLAADNIIKDPRHLIWLVKLRGDSHNLKAGEYFLEPNITNLQLLEKLIQGKVVQYSFTIVNGWRFEQLLKNLHEQPKIMNTLSGIELNNILSAIGRKGEHPEGLFLADTYFYTAKTKDTIILQRAYDLMQTKLKKSYENRKQNSSIKTPYQALILASILEKEAKFTEELAEISGVYHRRLDINMRLQADPTVIYALGADFNPPLTRNKLKIESAYNTYKNKGLPPTPIALPSMAAIDAALNPSDSEDLYFVANSSGRHIFSKTLEEHNYNSALSKTSKTSENR